jgi:hypothetical protein
MGARSVVGRDVRAQYAGQSRCTEDDDVVEALLSDRPNEPFGVRGARLMRAPLAGGQEELVLERVRAFLWSVTDKGIVFVSREPDFDAIDMYRFSDQRVARVGRLAFRVPGIFEHLTVSRDGRWALATDMVRFDSDLMLLDNFR